VKKGERERKLCGRRERELCGSRVSFGREEFLQRGEKLSPQIST